MSRHRYERRERDGLCDITRERICLLAGCRTCERKKIDEMCELNWLWEYDRTHTDEWKLLHAEISFFAQLPEPLGLIMVGFSMCRVIFLDSFRFFGVLGASQVRC